MLGEGILETTKNERCCPKLDMADLEPVVLNDIISVAHKCSMILPYIALTTNNL